MFDKEIFKWEMIEKLSRELQCIRNTPFLHRHKNVTSQRHSKLLKKMLKTLSGFYKFISFVYYTECF